MWQSRGSGASPSPACCALGAHAAWGCPLHFLLARGVPLLPLRNVMRWERTLPFRGVLPFVWAWLARPLPPPARARFACAAWAGGPLPRPGPCRAGGSHAGVIREVSLCPRYAPWARTAGLGVPLFLLLWAAACFRCRQPFGAEARLGLSSVGLLRFESSLGAPLWIHFPFTQRVPRCSDWGYSPVPLLRAVGARFWVGIPPTPPPP